MNRPQQPLPEEIEFVNVWQNAMISGRVAIVHGQVRNAPRGAGSVVVYVSRGNFPSQRFPLMDGYFKALVRLEEGSNKIMFEAELPDNSRRRQELVLQYKPVKEDPPVHYCLLVAKDSPLVFDSPQYKIEREGNGLDTAIRKLRLGAYMMSAFTMEQMNRNQMGMRTFRPYEEEEKCTLSYRDNASSRATVHVHVVKMDKTVAEIQDPDVAQQNSDAKRAGDLYGWAADALRAYGGPFAGDNFAQAACLYMDTHWDPKRKLVLGHAALGGNAGNLRLAIFGGHTLHSWPNNFEDLPAAFLDETRTDTNVVANDANQSGTAWEACNIGQGAFMHEVGHLLGCPHEPDGIMLRGYLNWNRSFMAIEGWNQRENKRRLEVVRANDEDYWNRLDIMRFRFHRSFQLPGEPDLGSASKPMIYPTKRGVALQNPQGIYMVDIHVDDWSKGHIEFMDCPKSVELSIDDLKRALPSDVRNKPFDIHVHSPPMEQSDVKDVEKFLRESLNGKYCQSALSGREDGEKKVAELPDKGLASVTVFSGLGLDGFEFKYTDGQTVQFGNRGGSPHVYQMNGEKLVGISVRSGYWVDAGGVITERGRTDVTGGDGGGASDLIPPSGHRLAGIFGYYTNWCQGIGILYEP